MAKKQGKSVSKQTEPSVPAPHFGDRMHRLREEFDHLASDLFGGNWLSRRPFDDQSLFSSDFMPGFGKNSPSVDIHENDTTITVTAELPGMEEKDVDLAIKNGVLTLKGEKRSETTEGKDEARVVERRYGSFQRSFTLPDTVEEENATAKFDKGVLTVTLPKRPGSETKERKIKITNV